MKVEIGQCEEGAQEMSGLLASGTEEADLAAKMSGLLSGASTDATKEEDAQERNQLHDGEIVVERSGPEVGTAKDFECLGLPENILKGVYAMGFNKPSRIQETALPILMKDPMEDMIAQSQSGTGKTAAFSLAMLYRVDPSVAEVQAVCISPARELARQTDSVIRTMAKYMGIDILLAVPGSIDLPQKGQKVNPHVVIGTPGKLQDLIKMGCIKVGKVKVLVYDEADQMFANEGNKDSLTAQAKRLKSMMKKAQVLLFSATFREEVLKFASTVIREPSTKITLKQEDLTLSALSQLYIKVSDEDHKFRVISDIYSYVTVGQSIIFVNRVHTAKRLKAHMESQDHKVGVLYGRGMDTETRDAEIDAFRAGKTRHLITTNVLSRGIDIAQVSLVINVDLPVMHETNEADTSTYLHRIGRTARYGRPGYAISLIAPDEMRLRDELISYFSCTIDEYLEDDLQDLDDKLRAMGAYEAHTPTNKE